MDNKIKKIIYMFLNSLYEREKWYIVKSSISDKQLIVNGNFTEDSELYFTLGKKNQPINRLINIIKKYIPLDDEVISKYCELWAGENIDKLKSLPRIR